MKMFGILFLSIMNAIFLPSGETAGQMSFDGVLVKLMGSFNPADWMKISGFPVLSELEAI